MRIIQTAERVSHEDMSDNYVYQRSLLAYVEVAGIVSGNVLEIGTGSGYGVEMIAKLTEKFVTIDKTKVTRDYPERDGVNYLRMKVPPLTNIPDNSFDFVISFQVIEHIKNDADFIAEVHRVLKDGGKLIISTPNKTMSLTRNPWHVREYTKEEFTILLQSHFDPIRELGVYGNERAMTYYNMNRRAVRRITRYDIFRLQYRCPAALLRVPYDIMNRVNRRKLLKSCNSSGMLDLSLTDFYLDTATDRCLDLFYIAEKTGGN